MEDKQLVDVVKTNMTILKLWLNQFVALLNIHIMDKVWLIMIAMLCAKIGIIGQKLANYYGIMTIKLLVVGRITPNSRAGAAITI